MCRKLDLPFFVFLVSVCVCACVPHTGLHLGVRVCVRQCPTCDDFLLLAIVLFGRSVPLAGPARVLYRTYVMPSALAYGEERSLTYMFDIFSDAILDANIGFALFPRPLFFV